MLRITTIAAKDRTILKLEGKLRGPWVAELEKVWREVQPTTERKPIRGDLRDVSYIDECGKTVLAGMRHDGVELVAIDPLIRWMLKDLGAGPLEQRAALAVSHVGKAR